MQHIITYILQWLCYDNNQAAARVAYTKDRKALDTHDVLIIPNGHLGKDIIVPEMSNPVVEKVSKGKYIISTDLVYAVFFFTSRAEELINTRRDEHGRFIAKYSVLGQKNRLLIPLLDEYARVLLKCLEEPLPPARFAHIYLTHDIDTIAQYRHLRGAIGALFRGEREQMWQAQLNIHKDPLYTFPWIIEQDAKVKANAESIYFVKHTDGKGYDYPQYSLLGKDFKHLKQLLLNSGARMGIHSSYYGNLPQQLPYTLHRSHYLRCSIEQMERLAQAGITDDFTMGFADHAGFRLQTTRSVRWIDPRTYTLTQLVLHPLTVMDCTLSNENYMNLSEDEAYFLCEQLLDKVKMHHGDVCLLWHNSIFTPDTYHKSLYEKILGTL